jgi:ubiquinone/menaquinone biosynthesis C-methylase UbiE
MFLRGFGPVFQAGLVRVGDPPREEPERSVIALAQRAGVEDGHRILDAGCGVAGPAVIIARHFPAVVIDAVTNSARQVAIGGERIRAAGLSDRVRIHLADYQRLPFRSEAFDRVLFFESTGYATDLDLTYQEAYRVLAPGGGLYVKDVFRDPEVGGELATERIEAFDRLWGCVRTKTLSESVAAILRAGFKKTSASPMPELGTASFAGSMFLLDGHALGRSEFGDAFLSAALGGPIEFGEIRAVKP